MHELHQNTRSSIGTLVQLRFWCLCDMLPIFGFNVELNIFYIFIKVNFEEKKIIWMLVNTHEMMRYETLIYCVVKHWINLRLVIYWSGVHFICRRFAQKRKRWPPFFIFLFCLIYDWQHYIKFLGKVEYGDFFYFQKCARILCHFQRTFEQQRLSLKDFKSNLNFVFTKSKYIYYCI